MGGGVVEQFGSRSGVDFGGFDGQALLLLFISGLEGAGKDSARVLAEVPGASSGSPSSTIVPIPQSEQNMFSPTLPRIVSRCFSRWVKSANELL